MSRGRLREHGSHRGFDPFPERDDALYLRA
jgi:hypothetical protein